MPHRTQTFVRNRILAALPSAEYKLIVDRLQRVEHALGQSLHRAGEPIEQVFFVENGFISALTMLSDGAPLEIGLIGAEGVAGVSVVLGATHSYSETMCQTPGAAYRISTHALKEVVAQTPHLRDLLLRYTHVFHVQVAQTAACNAHHDLGQRLARWLLAAHDRSGQAELSLTQDLIAVMLGVRRSTVSIAASTLQRAGVIRYQHGRITILWTGSGSRMLPASAMRPWRASIAPCSAIARLSSRLPPLRSARQLQKLFSNESVAAPTLGRNEPFVPRDAGRMSYAANVLRHEPAAVGQQLYRQRASG